jgi:hypothetical protein
MPWRLTVKIKPLLTFLKPINIKDVVICQHLICDQIIPMKFHQVPHLGVLLMILTVLVVIR